MAGEDPRITRTPIVPENIYILEIVSPELGTCHFPASPRAGATYGMWQDGKRAGATYGM